MHVQRVMKIASYVNHFVNVTVDVGERQKC